MATLTVNGQKVQVSDDFLKLSPEQQNATVDEIAKSLGSKPTVQPSPAIKAGQDIVYAGQWDKQPGPMDYLTQGMSGINEGIAQGLGLPVDLATMGINAATSGINKLAHTDIPQITQPFGGSGTFTQLLSPTIKPESTDPGQQMTRRIGQEVGAMLIPGMGPVAKAAKPMATAGRELVAALGSGTGAAIAQQAFPGNPVAEFAGQMIGGLAPGGAARLATKAPKAAMSVEDLRGATNAAYEKTRNLGVAYAPATYDNMLAKIVNETKADGISPDRHKDAYSFMVDMIGARGKPLTLTELDQLRQRVRRDLITPSYGNPAKAADAHFGQIMLDNIDEMIANAGPGDMVAGSAKDAANAIITARSLNTRLRKSELLQDAVEKAKLNAAASGSGGNVNNAIRQQIKGILTNPKKVKAFTAEERALMQKVIEGGPTENFLRLVGKLSPSGNGLMAALGIGGTAMNPALAAAPIAGLVAKNIADKGTINKVTRLQNVVAGGVPVAPKRPFLSPAERAALVAAQASTQKKPLHITVNGGAR